MKITNLVIYVVLGSIFAIGALALRSHIHIYSISSLVESPIIENEGLILPSVEGDSASNIIYIYHQGSRRLNPITIEHWKKLDGVIDVQEQDYSVIIIRSHNFEWDEIFPQPKKTNNHKGGFPI